MEIQRKIYLDALLRKRGNRLIKIITGLRRCGKSYLLRTLFKNQLLKEGISEDHVVEMSFDFLENAAYLEATKFHEWAKSRIKDDGNYFQANRFVV